MVQVCPRKHPASLILFQVLQQDQQSLGDVLSRGRSTRGQALPTSSPVIPIAHGVGHTVLQVQAQGQAQPQGGQFKPEEHRQSAPTCSFQLCVQFHTVLTNGIVLKDGITKFVVELFPP
ncbi:unnamed protein product [Rangifer tarandus platyrhynchus]|uniref:Uncharacterized protein n=2 Tax=Rangifer tarandus platyrhynchus TaxID=3082113 RepID=A0ABN8Y3D8_RANTA|nr:unnamed protein product [Rangifer tarandus platyrhynchus]